MIDTITMAIEIASSQYSCATLSLFGYDGDGYPELILSSLVAEDISDAFRFESSEGNFAGLEVRVNGIRIAVN